MTGASVKVIFDTNIWVSFLIGKRIGAIKPHLVSGKIIVVTSPQLIAELKEVTSRERLKVYFPEDHVFDLLQLLDVIGIKVETDSIHDESRDPKDNFLLDLIDASEADYLVTGDKGLLELDPFLSARIITPARFESVINAL